MSVERARGPHRFHGTLNIGGLCLRHLAVLLLLGALSCPGLRAGEAADSPANISPAAPKPEGRACCRKQPETTAARPCCSGKHATPEIENPESKVENTASFTKESLYQTDGRFTADSGQPFALGSLRGRPVVIDLFFASCGYACPLAVTDLLAIQGRLPAEVRRQAVFVLVSFDVARDTPAALAKYRQQRGLDGQWVLLHGGDDSVRELAALLGVKYKQEADGTFSHSNVITVLNREGEIVHQRLGLNGGLDTAAAAIAAASRN